MVSKSTSRLVWIAAGAVALAFTTGAAPVTPDPGPPESLAAWYPPRSGERVYTAEMLELGRLYGTMSIDATDGSLHISRSIDEFAEQYGKVSKMVPEWKDYFPAFSFEQVSKAANTKAGAEEARTLIEDVGQTCTNCHVQEMFRVQAVYSWPRFDVVRVTDDSGKRIAFHDTMVDLSNEMAALPELVRRGDWPEAVKHQEVLRQQFDLLERSCDNCHTVSREYFVDKMMKAKVLKLGGMTRSKTGTPEEYEAVMQELTKGSCIPCHQVHMPAAWLQRRLFP